jgi:hypothetical protein
MVAADDPSAVAVGPFIAEAFGSGRAGRPPLVRALKHGYRSRGALRSTAFRDDASTRTVVTVGPIVGALPKILMLLGAALLLLGAVLFLGQRLGLGRLPGDFSWQGKNFSFHFPLATSLLVSIVLTLVINLWLGRSR